MPPLLAGAGALALAGGGTAAATTGGITISSTAAAWILGTATVATVGGVAYANRDAIADSMSGAQTEVEPDDVDVKTAAAAAAAAAATVTCATCAQNPCAALACGGPTTGNYRGGAHGCMTLPVGDGKDSHHMPANSISPLPRPVGPSIQMDPRDHRLTNSYGASAATNAVLAGQQQQIQSGNFIAAQAIDVLEIEAKFPGKYTEAIAQMELYTACLKRYGIIR